MIKSMKWLKIFNSPSHVHGGHLCISDFLNYILETNEYKCAALLLKKLWDGGRKAMDIIFSLSSGYSKSSADTNDPCIHSTHIYCTSKKIIFFVFLDYFYM